jgi:hypothetical protein
MSFLLKLSELACKVNGALCFSLLMLFSIGNAQAVTIDFDDLEPGSFLPGDSFNPPINRLESLGIAIEGYVQPLAASTKSAPNFLWGSVGFSIYFIDTPPTYVSMYVGSIQEYKVWLRAFDANGNSEVKNTEGGVRGIQWEDSTPYSPNQFISFYMPEGITNINIGGQADAYIDDLSFSVSVPEPGTFILVCLGLLMIYMHRKCLQ